MHEERMIQKENNKKLSLELKLLCYYANIIEQLCWKKRRKFEKEKKLGKQQTTWQKKRKEKLKM
jgi:hypothetical protein